MHTCCLSANAGVGRKEENADARIAVQEISGTADEDAERLPAVLRALREAERVQKITR